MCLHMQYFTPYITLSFKQNVSSNDCMCVFTVHIPMHVLIGEGPGNKNRSGHDVGCSPKHNPLPQWLWQQGHSALESKAAECALPPALQENSFCQAHNYARLISSDLR